MAGFITFASGVVAATADAAVAARVIGGVLFVLGAYALVDALVMTASWRLTAVGLKIPTVVSRRREIAGDPNLVVTPGGRWVGAIVVSGDRGRRVMTTNPLVSPADLRSWFAEIADGADDPNSGPT